jgi:hypothetical protein
VRCALCVPFDDCVLTTLLSVQASSVDISSDDDTRGAAAEEGRGAGPEAEDEGRGLAEEDEDDPRWALLLLLQGGPRGVAAVISTERRCTCTVQQQAVQRQRCQVVR